MKKTMFAIMLFSLFSILTFGQASTGTLSGVVSAPDGVIAGATVLVKDNQTGRERTVITSGEGSFTVSQLDFGTYSVTITATGYKTFISKDVKIDAGRESALTITMEVGGVNEEVTITSAGELVNSANAELSTSISAKQVKELPIDGRNPLALVSLQAGANATTNSISGQRSSSTTITRDGINVQDNFIRTGGFVADRPTVDDVSEVTVITQNAGVEQGGGSSVVQLVTPRGGNKFSGSLYAVNRNSAFTANTWANNFNGVSKPFLNRNQYGGTIGGPVPVFNFGEGGPMFLRDKGFFFFNYEGFRLSQQVAASGTTLLPDARTGNFTYVGTDGVTRTVNVLTGAGFNLSTPANQALFANAGGPLTVDPIIKARLLDKLPTSGNGITTGINYLQTVNFNRANGATRSNYAGRFDLDINEKNTVNFVYKKTLEDNLRADQASGFATTPFVTQGGPTDFFVTSYRLTPTSNFSTEFRFGLQFSTPFFNESNVPSDYLISQALFTNPEGSFRAQGRDTKLYTFQNNSVWTLGNHSLRMGGQFEYYNVTSTNLASSTPTYTILGSAGNTQSPVLTNNLLTGINATDLARVNTLRNTLAGLVGGASVSANLISPTEGYAFIPSIQTFKYNTISGYISDNWRARPNLSLNLGLRYDYYFPLRTPQQKYLEPVITNGDIIGSLSNPNATLDLVGKNSGVPGEYFNSDPNNFAPSLSFAYSPQFEKGLLAGLTSGDMVIRGGFAVRYINDEYVKAASTLVAANPGLGTSALTARNAQGTADLRAALTPNGIYGAVPTFTLPSVRTIPYLISTRNAEGGFGTTIFGVDPNLKVQQTYEWNIGIQRSFLYNTVVEARYVGGMSNSAVRTKDFNQVDIINNGFLGDFIKAQNNCRLQGATLLPAGSTTDPITVCTSAAYNPAITGSQQLTVFNNLQGGGFLTTGSNANTPTYLGNLRTNSPNLLARNYIIARQTGSVVFQPGSNALAYEILVNEGKYRYNALQLELRRRFANGIAFQVNYTFSKSLTDILSDVNADQNRQGTFLDNNRPNLNYGRADYDRTHALNANFILELPFGKGKRFLNSGGIVNAIFGGFQFSSIIQYTSGAPLGIIDPRSSFSSRNGRQGAISTLSADELKDLTGIFRTPNGVYFVNPKVLYAIATAPGQPTLNNFDLTQTLPAGYTLQSVRITAPINTPAYPNQFLFYNQPGQTGNLPVNFINGTPYYNWNASLRKNFNLGETRRIQLSMDAFNVLNSTVISFSSDLNIDSTTFSRTTSAFANRVIQFGARFDF
jgi:hypothetical protein